MLATSQVELPASRRRRFQRGFTGLVALVGLAGVAFVAGKQLGRADVGPPAYGASLPEFGEVALDGQPIESREWFGGRFGLLLYAHEEPDPSLVRYLEVLLERYGSRDPGLRVVLAVGGTHLDRRAAEAVAVHATYPVLYDDGGKLRRTFGLGRHDDHTFVVAGDHRLLFSAGGLAGREELRQHVEKYLLGEIHYGASPVTFLGPDATLPEYEVANVGLSGREGVATAYSPLAGTVVLAVPASVCSACDVAALYDRMAAFYRGACGGESAVRCPVDVLVTAGFPGLDLSRALAERGVERVPVYQAVGSLSGLEDEYFPRPRQGAGDALVLRLGAARRVLKVLPLADALELADAS